MNVDHCVIIRIKNESRISVDYLKFKLEENKMNRRSVSPMRKSGNAKSGDSSQPVAPPRRRRGKSLSMTILSGMGSSFESNDPYNQMYANSPPMIQNTFGYDRGDYLISY